MTLTRTDHIHVAAPRSVVLDVLVDVAALPDWNPAITHLTGRGVAVVGHPYPVRVRGLLGGHLVYDRVETGLVRMSIDVPGLAENGHWALEEEDGATTVRHGYTQTGPLARLLEPATREVARWRLERLRARAEAEASRIPT